MKFLTPLAWLLVLLYAGMLRFADLGSRPVHADEATGARLVARAMESPDFRFDPQHFHGPVLHRLGQVASALSGVHSWGEMEIAPLRAVTAAAGFLICALPLLGVRRFGHPSMLLAAALLASSPLLSYYSRMFIHETLLTLFALAALWQVTCTRQRWLGGLWIGLMFATKETFAISVMAWVAAGLATWRLAGRQRPSLRALFTRHAGQTGTALGLALLVSLAFYTDGFRHWRGAVDAVRTYFVYETVSGHDKPLAWYLEFLVLPAKLGGLWWWEGGILVLALASVIASCLPAAMPPATRHASRFLALSFLCHLLVYSLLAYKTPWLMLLPWAHACLLAGLTASTCTKPLARTALAAVSLVLCALLGFQAWRACFRFPSEARNRYAYVPTSPDIATLVPWLGDIAKAQPAGASVEPIGVIGQENYWPLPWYLRKFSKVGYWTDPPKSLERLPLVFATSDLAGDLGATHVPIPRGLRNGMPMTVWVRQDFWGNYVRSDD